MSSLQFSTRTALSKRVSLISKYLGVGLALASMASVLMPMAHAATTTTSNGQAILMLSPDTGNFAVGDKVTMQVLLDTKGLEVSQVDFKLQYDPSYLEVQDSDLTKSGLQIKDGDLFEVLLSSSPVNSTTGMIQYSKLALSESKYYKTTGTPGKLATIDFKALKAGSTKLTFQTADGISTKIYRATDDSQVLGEVTNADITIGAGSGQSSMATSSPSASASPSATPSVSATPTTSALANKLSLALALNKNSLQADGADKATLQATVKDKDGKAVPNSKVVFGLTGNAVLGALSAMTNASGVASTTITAGTQAGNVSVSANLDTDPTVSSAVQVTLVAKPAATPTLTAKPVTSPVATPSAAPQVIPAPDHLNQVGPADTLAMSLILSMALASLVLMAPRLVKVIVKK